MSKAESSLNRFLDWRITGEQHGDGWMLDPVAETGDEVQNWANQILPGAAFSAALRTQLLGDDQMQVSAITTEVFDSWSATTGSNSPIRLFRRVCEIAALTIVFVVGAYMFVQWAAGNAGSPKSNTGVSLSLPAATTAPETSQSLPGARVYDSTRIGAILNVNVDQAQLRAEPSFEAKTVRQLARGEQVKVLGTGIGSVAELSFFLDVETSEALRGWIWVEAVTLSDEEIAIQNTFTPILGMTTGSSVKTEFTGTTSVEFAIDTQLVVTKPTRLRVEPGSDGYAFSELEEGDHVWSSGVQIQTGDEIWIGVQYLGSGRTYWVAASALTPWANVPKSPSVEGSALSRTPETYSPKVIVVGEQTSGKDDFVETIFEIALRQEPDAASAVVGLLPAGTPLLVTGEIAAGAASTAWLPVLDSVTGNSGWVPLAWVQYISHEAELVRVGARLTVKLPYNVRTNHSFQADSVTVLDPGETFIVLETGVFDEDADWMRVRMSNGETGWLAIVSDDPGILFGTPSPED